MRHAIALSVASILVGSVPNAGAQPVRPPDVQIPARNQALDVVRGMNMDIDPISVLGTYWGEQPLHAFVTSLGVTGVPKLRHGDFTDHLQNPEIGIELTFCIEDWLDVPLRRYPKGALVLDNVRFYGKSIRFSPFEGRLPLGLEFGATRESLIEQLGPPASEVPDRGIIRWDRDRYCVFAVMADDGTMQSLALQLPVTKLDP